MYSYVGYVGGVGNHWCILNVCVCVCVCAHARARACVLSCSVLSDSVTLWTVAHQVHGILQQEYWIELPGPPPRHLPDSGSKPRALFSTAVVMNVSHHVQVYRF